MGLISFTKVIVKLLLTCGSGVGSCESGRYNVRRTNPKAHK